MKLKFNQHDAPIIIGVVREATADAAIRAIKNCKLHGATGIDLHVSCLEEKYQSVDQLRSVISSTDLPVLALNYNQRVDRSSLDADEETRLELLVRAAEAGADAVDMQGYSFDPVSKSGFDPAFASLGYSFIQNNPREIVVNPAVIEKQRAFIDRIHSLGAQVLISNHPGVFLNTEQVLDWVHFLEERQPDAIKIVLIADNEDQLADSFKTMIKLRHEPIPVSLHCGGPAGRLSRIINPILGGYLAFCVDGYNPYDDINQLDIQAMRAVIDNVNKLR